MGNDEAALLRLWREKRGEAERPDYSDNLIVQLGVATEPLNRHWYERTTGQLVKDVQSWVRHPVIRWMAATLDGIIEGTGAVFEAKFMLPWSFSEEAAAEKHMAQVQHNMWVTNAREAALSVITGGGKWIEIKLIADHRPESYRCQSLSEAGLLRPSSPLASRDEFVLVVAWVLAALRSGGPYPLLAISGEQGSAKTVLSKLLKALIDPNTAPVRALSREERELMIAANNGHLLAFDNLSSLPNWLSDALCRLATGGSFAVRQLYTDDDEVLFEAARPILLNGIEEVVNRPDLGDRAIFLTLAPIVEAQRRSEAELWRQFEIARPRILGALLDAVVHGLHALGRVHLERMPRMADFARWAAACETALWPAGTFARAYAANRRTAVENMIEADPVAACVRGLMAARSAWTGSAADLLRAADFAGGQVWNRSAGWPKTPRALAGRLRRAQTFLRRMGIEVSFSREGRAGTRVISVSASSEHTVSTVSSVRQEESGSKCPQLADDVRDNKYRPEMVSRCSIGQASVITAADDADGADGEARVRLSWPNGGLRGAYRLIIWNFTRP